MLPLTLRPKAATAMAMATAETSTTAPIVPRSDSARCFTKLVNSLSSGLLEFDQGAVEVLGVQEKHRFPMGSDLRLARAQHPGPGIHKLVPYRTDIVDLVADMMNAAVRVLLQEAGDGRLAA